MMSRLALVLGSVLVACGTSGLVQTALHGDLATLKREIAAEQRRGELDREQAHELARAVAGREIRAATGEEAAARIRAASACASDLLPELRDRAERKDDAAAEAWLVLIDGKQADRRSARAHGEAASGAFRAVAARAAATIELGHVRRKFLLDPDERVRRAALRAAMEAQDPADEAVLLEAARLDPDPLARSMALRAAGAIGTPHVVTSLMDLWARADALERLSIVDGWAMPRAFAAGGRERLIGVVETSTGLPALAAADALLRRGGAGADLGRATLARAATEGTTAERVFALGRLPADVPLLHRVASTDDLAVRVVALERLASVQGERAAALKALRAIASSNAPMAFEARVALARAGDDSVVPALARSLSSRSARERRAAALALVELGDYSRAAPALADDDPDLRLQVACSILAQEP